MFYYKIRKFNNTYYLFYIAGSNWIENNGKPEPVYKIRMATVKFNEYMKTKNDK